jgi:hypothetical protein
VSKGPLAYRVEPLGDHGRTAFSCGVEPLDRYLKQQASQKHRRHVAKCFVAIQTAEETLGGFFTLSAPSILFSDLPAGFAKRLPRYPQVPAALLGRLAVDRGHQARGLAIFYFSMPCVASCTPTPRQRFCLSMPRMIPLCVFTRAMASLKSAPATNDFICPLARSRKFSPEPLPPSVRKAGNLSPNAR